MGNRWGYSGNSVRLYFSGLQNHCRWWLQPWRHLLLGRKVMTNLDRILKSRDITSPTQVCLVKAMIFPAVMCGCESWTVKKAEHQRIGTFELWCWRRLLRVPWTARRSVHSKGDQSWVFIGRTDVEAETPILWPPDAKSWLIWKEPDAGKDWGQEEKETTEDEMAGWHHWLDGRESEWTLGVGDGQGGLACCDSWDRKESDTTEQLNWSCISGQLLFPLQEFKHTDNHDKLWKALREMGIPDHLTCPLRNLCAGQEAIVRTLYGTTDWFKIEKRVQQGCLLLPFV